MMCARPPHDAEVRPPMKITILDDYLDTLRTLDCFRELDGHDVTVWNDRTADVDVLAERLARHRRAGAHPGAHADHRRAAWSDSPRCA